MRGGSIAFLDLITSCFACFFVAMVSSVAVISVRLAVTVINPPVLLQ